jgi:hypothetical protein
MKHPLPLLCACEITKTKDAEAIADVKDEVQGQSDPVTADKTKKPVSNVVWVRARPIMHGIANVSGTAS